MRFPRLRRVLAGGALLAAGALVHAAAPAADASTVPARVTVNTRAGLATVPGTGIGVNHAIWDTHLGAAPVADLLKDAGVQMIRYPGGSYADIYHWQNHTAPGGYVAPDTDFDTFMSGVRRTGAQPIVIANYGTGTPQEAAAWVEYANVTKGYGVKYWEIGNENYGNGHYGSQWEADDHADKSPAEYARNVVAYSQAMKAKDPTIKIGAVLTTPAGWPDAITAAGDSGSWNQTVLSIAGPSIDFGILHWYPGQSGMADMLTRPAQIDDMIHLVKRQIAQYAGAGSSRIGLAVTEVSSTVGTNTQPGALFAAEAYARLLENGVFTVDWWNVHNGIGTVSEVAGHTDYGDWGLLSSANCAGDVCQPALNTPFPPYHALDMLSVFARPGDQMVRATADEPLISAHAVRRANGEVALLLVNKDPDAPREVTIDYSGGFAPAAGAPMVHSFTNGAAGVSAAPAGTATSQVLPPYSLTTVVLRPATPVTGAPGAPGQPEVTAVTDTTATIAWTAATPGSRPIVKYEVHRQAGATSDQWGETPGTSFTVRNLLPGTRYTVNVLTRDAGGGLSWASAPLTFTTGTPAASSCSVRFTDNNDWGNGYIVGLDVTNNDTEPLSAWTLTYSWPTAWQQINGGWNAGWAQDGRKVTVTSLEGSTLAPGATTSAGTVASYSGPNVLPAVFKLNGRTCTTL
ncbi:cellulose binding domain-containing protein [Sphaerisporangium aureirubrum]|uniref:Cellulose binding domain-containing protein n=1 Tax=Sphaerisporangium aureirubrum TaxID=1544736 RepID=A0ABW1NH50_9ACTN